jgi:beta-lactam-binding protein with PASTA domain
MERFGEPSARRARRGLRTPLLLAALGLALACTPVSGAGAGRAASRVVVPSVTGLMTQAARRKLVALGLRVAVEPVASAKPAGTVVAQRPRARVRVARGTTVRLGVAAGAAQVAVPDVIGDEKDLAEQRLQVAGLSPNVLYVESLHLVGTVVAQDPPGGARVDPGTRVTISISRGPGP